MPIPPNGLLLGFQDQAPIWDTDREGHLITIAPTGAGKGVSCAIPALLTWQGPAIVVDPRGENYAVTAARRRAMGHIVHRLDPFRVAGRHNGDSLNPLDLVDPHAGDFEDDAAVVAHLCMQHAQLPHDPFWDERATAMIVKIICALFKTMSSRRPTLHDVQAILQGLPVYTHPLAELDADQDPAHAMLTLQIQKLIRSSEFSTERTRASIMATANSHLGFLRSPAVHGCLSDSTITLDDVTAGAMHTIYLIIPPDKLVSHGKLVRLWIGVMLAAISRRQRAPAQPTLFLIDEAAQFGEMNELRAALTLMRAYGLRVWMFFQDISQLQSVYRRDWESIINNCKIQQYFGAKSPHARKALKLFIGDDAINLPDDHQMLFDGRTLSATQRANYLTDPLLKGLASPHPFHIPQKELQLQ